MKRRWPLYLGLAGILLAGTLFTCWLLLQPEPRLGFSLPDNRFPLATLKKDDRPPFRIDPTNPYRIELGRGSGQYGLDTVTITQDGEVVLYRRGKMATWFKGTMQLPDEAVGQVLKAVEDNKLLGLHKEYHANVADGTQWVLWIKQGENEKSVYFNNYFPPEIVKFAESLDKLLSENESGNVTWLPASVDHDKDLWESIKR